MAAKLYGDDTAQRAGRLTLNPVAHILILMVFNLIPLGALDGHYILPYFLPEQLALRYRYYNARYGNFVLLGFIVLSIMGLPVFKYVFSVSEYLLRLIVFV